MQKLPTSNIEKFREHLLNTNQNFPISESDDVGEISKVQKNNVIAFRADESGCGYLRCVFPMTYMNSVFGKSGRFNIMILPQAMIFQPDILMKTRSIFFQRTMSPNQVDGVRQYKNLQSKYGYKMIFDIDDFIWKGEDDGESIPDYNFGAAGIKDEVRTSCIDIMNMMDIVCVSTDFLGDYIKKKGVNVPIKTMPNVVPQYFWGNKRKKPIKEKIVKPRILYSSSPTHFNNEKRLKGDMNNAWCDWVIKNVKENKIEFMQMGGLPFFFEEIKNRIKVVQWVNSFQFHLPILNFKPHFCIAPLVPNYFNYSKSDLKFIEASAIGSVFIGSVFTNGKPSPYDNCYVKVPDNIDVQGIDEIFWKLTEPEAYNEIISKQYKMMFEDGRYLESEKAVKRYTEIL